jgi:hypothetical protein
MTGGATQSDSGQTPETLLRPFSHYAGLRWYSDLPSRLAEPCDTSDAPISSSLQLFEDGVALGPAHALHQAIESEGRGRYSHWGGGLWFSTSDGTDPNANGRTYTVAIGDRPLTLLGFGSCHLHDALGGLRTRGLANVRWATPSLSYSPQETLQLIEDHLGLTQIPDVLRDFALASEPQASPLRDIVHAADVVVLEFGSAIDVAYGAFCVPRSQLNAGLVEPIAALGRAERRIVMRWYHQGLMKQNEAARQECVEQLLKLLPAANLDCVLVGDILNHTRGLSHANDAVMQTIAQIRDVLQAKTVCVISTQNIFTPDGRPVTWPGNFPKDLEVVCRSMALPLLHSSDLVRQRGVHFSLENDLFHFTPQFLAVFGDEILAMAERVIAATDAAQGSARSLRESAP